MDKDGAVNRRPAFDAATCVGSHQIELERSSSAPGAARRHVERHREELGEASWQRARLLVTELTTNALRHGAGAIVLEVADNGSALWFCVRDEGDVKPEARTPDDEGGFGLHLVERFADRWGRPPGGGAVWFEIERAPDLALV